MKSWLGFYAHVERVLVRCLRQKTRIIVRFPGGVGSHQTGVFDSVVFVVLAETRRGHAGAWRGGESARDVYSYGFRRGV